MNELLLQSVEIITLIIISGWLSMIETALQETLHGKIEKLANDSGENPKKVLEMTESPEKYLSAARIGRTAAEIFSGVLAVIFAEKFSIAVSIIIFFAMILFGRVLPIKYAVQMPEEVLLKNYKLFVAVKNILSPCEKIFSKIADVIMIIIGRDEKISDAAVEDEVKDLIEQGTESGVFEESEREMVDKIFYLSDQNVYSLMTPRLQIVWLDLNDSIEQNLKTVRENPQNIFLVGAGSLDECRGVIYAKDLLDATLDNKIELENLIKKPVFVPRTMEIFRVVEKFKNTGESSAIVNDEYGGVIGFITLDDISKEIVGLTEVEKFIPQKNNSWLVNGLCDIDDFKKKFKFETLPNEERDHFQTMGGFLTSRFGYIPKVGEKKDWDNLRFEVLKMDGARIDKILITELEK